MACEGVVRRGRRLGAWAMNDDLFGGIRLSWSAEDVFEIQVMVRFEQCCAQPSEALANMCVKRAFDL